jgi:hypothetical protein
MRCRTGEEKFVLLINRSSLPDEAYPFIGFGLGGCLKVIVSRRGEEAKQVMAFLLWVSEVGDGGELGKVDFMPQIVLHLRLVD